jgi:hypothetical protein
MIVLQPTDREEARAPSKLGNLKDVSATQEDVSMTRISQILVYLLWR